MNGLHFAEVQVPFIKKREREKWEGEQAGDSLLSLITSIYSERRGGGVSEGASAIHEASLSPDVSLCKHTGCTTASGTNDAG